MYKMSDSAVFDFNEMTLSFFDSNDTDITHYKKFPIGELFISFLNCDFSQYEIDRQSIFEKLKDNSFIAKATEQMSEKAELIILELLGAVNKDPIEKLQRIASFELTSRYTDLHYYIGKSYAETFIDDLDYAETQNVFKDIVDFCFNLNNNTILEQLSIEYRFLLYMNLGEYCDSFRNLTFPSTLLPIVDREYIDYLFVIKDFDMIPKKINQKMINKIKQLNVQLKEHYIFDNYFSMLYLEFTKIVSGKFNIKKCKNCKKYFLVTGNYNTEYCNYIQDGETKTCREIGAVRKYAEKINDNPILKAYNRAYKTHFARIRYKSMTKEQFSKWADAAKEKKEKALAGEISLDTFEAWLKI